QHVPSKWNSCARALTALSSGCTSQRATSAKLGGNLSAAGGRCTTSWVSSRRTSCVTLSPTGTPAGDRDLATVLDGPVASGRPICSGSCGGKAAHGHHSRGGLGLDGLTEQGREFRVRLNTQLTVEDIAVGFESAAAFDPVTLRQMRLN